MKNLTLLAVAVVLIGCPSRLRISDLPEKSQEILKTEFDEDFLRDVTILYGNTTDKAMDLVSKASGVRPAGMGYRIPGTELYRVVLRKDIVDVDDCGVLGLIGHEICHCRQGEREDWQMFLNYFIDYADGRIHGETAKEAYQNNKYEVECREVGSRIKKKCLDSK